MKRLYYLCALIAFACSSCKKERPVPALSWTLQLNDADRASVDLSKYQLSKQGPYWYYVYPCRNWQLLVRTDSSNMFIDAKFMQLEETGDEKGKFNGHVRLQTLERKDLLQSAIINGYVKAWHPELSNTARASAVPHDIYLPEVIITAYYPSRQGLSSYTLLSLASFMNTGNLSGNNGMQDAGIGIYTPMGSSSSVSNIVGGSDIVIHQETSYQNPAIDMYAWMRCFDMLPDEGSQASVTLFCDLPVDDDPSAVYNWYTGATGHVFMELKKTRADQTVSQVIGFTAVSPFSVFGPTEHVPAKTVDNGGHKYNASLTINLTPQGLKQVIEQAKNFTANYDYNISSFNCIQYVLGSINTVMTDNPIKMPPVLQTSQYLPMNSPVLLYQQLQAMKAGNDRLAPNIHFDGPLHAGKSHGPCD